jgi:dihydrofolate reductase
MRKIIVLSFLTLDGVMQAPGGPEEDTSGDFKYGGWTAPYFDQQSGQEMGKQMSGEYDLLLGRKTYDIFAGYWPDHTEQWPQINSITKYAASRTLENPSWQNTVVLNDTSDIQKLKDADGPDLQVHGSGNLIQTLLKHDLVDELWLKFFPVTLGQGKRLFAEGTTPAAFDFIESKSMPGGVIFANYRRAGDVKTGTVGE